MLYFPPLDGPVRFNPTSEAWENILLSNTKAEKQPKKPRNTEKAPSKRGRKCKAMG